MKKFSEYSEDITIPINVGDTVLGGKFKNKKVVVKDIGKNEKGDLTINGRPLLKFRIMSEAEEMAEKILVDEGVRWAGSLSDKLFDVGMGLNGMWLPMSPSIFKRIGLEENRATVFHVTDADGYRSLKKMQGKKQSISAFFEMQSRYFSRGIQTTGGVIVELDANVLSAWREDVMSSPDKSGRRWIQLSYFGGMYRVQDDIDAMIGGDGKKNSMFELIKDLLKKYLPGQHAHKVTLYNATDKDLAKHWQNLALWLRKEKDYRKIMGNVVKDYIDGTERIMKANVKSLKSIFRSYLNRRNTDASWDEILVNQFKIKKVHAIDSDGWHRTSDSGDPDEDDYKGYLDFLEKVKADGYKAQYWESDMELEIYIRGIAKKESGSE